MEDFVIHSPEILFRNTHPDDLMRLFAFTNHWIAFFYGVACRKKNACTSYHLYTPAESGKIIQMGNDTICGTPAGCRWPYRLCFNACNRYFSRKKDGVAMMSILDTYDDSCQLFYCTDGKAVADTTIQIPKITPREIDVLRFLAIGYSSKQIAAELNIAIKTIDNHRQSLLRKSNTKSSAELVAYGINKGFI